MAVRAVWCHASPAPVTEETRESGLGSYCMRENGAASLQCEHVAHAVVRVACVVVG